MTTTATSTTNAATATAAATSHKRDSAYSSTPSTTPSGPTSFLGATSVTKLAPGTLSRPEEAASLPHHVLKKDGSRTGFKNMYPSWATDPNFGLAWRKIFWPLITGELKQPNTKPPTVPVVKPTWLPHRHASSKLRATWLGHACYHVEFPSGLRVLFDPVFEDRCSPLSFMGPKRFTEPPCAVADIPAVDAVLISHSHYDHLSHGSVLEVQKRHPDAQFFVGLGLASWFRKAGLKNVTELDWWEDAELKVKVKNPNKQGSGTGEGEEEIIKATVSSLPAQHTSARTPFDKDTTLWCSWAVKSGDKSVWFGGDTGYRAVPDVGKGIDDYGPEYESLPRCPQFKQIGTLRGPFDLGLIPIGAYHPRAVFSSMHANPYDSVEIFADTRCKRAMGIHWGTWALTMEEVLEPPVLLREAMRRKGFEETGVFDVCDIGASVEVE